MAEARRRIVGDCVAVCGCCPCLAVQIVVLLMIDAPKRLARKSWRFLKRKRRSRPNGDEISAAMAPSEEIFPISASITDGGGARYRCAMAEVREVMEELHERGEFSFGSFWRRRGVEEVAAVPPRNAAVVVEVRWL